MNTDVQWVGPEFDASRRRARDQSEGRGPDKGRMPERPLIRPQAERHEACAILYLTRYGGTETARLWDSSSQMVKATDFLIRRVRVQLPS